MKKIIFTRPDGGLTVLGPCEGNRLATAITLADGARIESQGAVPVDQLRRGWPIAGARAEWAETEAEFLARIIAKDVPAGASDVRIVDESAIPADRTYRNAWRAGAAGVEHDMAKAREIHKQRLRDRRATRLAALDVAYMRADEAGNQALKASIAAQKQALRDATDHPSIAAAQTVEELKLAVPPALAD